MFMGNTMFMIGLNVIYVLPNEHKEHFFCKRKEFWAIVSCYNVML